MGIAKKYVENWNATHPDGPYLYETAGGFATIPYCEDRGSYRVHVGHREDEPCPLDPVRTSLMSEINLVWRGICSASASS